MTDLDRKMSNGGSVRDWLGTAGVAAKVAGMRIDEIREYGAIRDGYGHDLNASLELVARDLEQAVAELSTVRAFLVTVGQFDANARIDRFMEATADGDPITTRRNIYNADTEATD